MRFQSSAIYTDDRAAVQINIYLHVVNVKRKTTRLIIKNGHQLHQLPSRGKSVHL